MDIGCHRNTVRASALAIVSLGQFLKHLGAVGGHEVTFLNRDLPYRDGEVFKVEEHGTYLVIPVRFNEGVPPEPPMFQDNLEGYAYWHVKL